DRAGGTGLRRGIRTDAPGVHVLCDWSRAGASARCGVWRDARRFRHGDWSRGIAARRGDPGLWVPGGVRHRGAFRGHVGALLPLHRASSRPPAASDRRGSVLTIADAHVHFFSAGFFRALGAQRPGDASEEPQADVVLPERLGWTPPGADTD